ncbi:MAG TPA: hypothetical protein VFH77_10295 [Streptomyces sp.]|jgi:hypothetical protein|nr:hypothetical protein [Streptomyces sp.]
MRKLSKAAVVAAMLGTAGFAGAGTAAADAPFGGPMGGPDISVDQTVDCTSHDLNVGILSNLSLLNGLGGNLANGEGNPGLTQQHQGSEMGCSPTAFTG